ncbi:MAG TPA: dihydroneopterin aldolase [Campylobacterales bacterium]|nr:dihydroneopterin aldolase [Campylobacterales bacterium]
MTIHIENLTFETIIGLLEFERIHAQKIVLNLTIDYHYLENKFIDYAEVISIVENDFHENQYLLLETALEKLSDKLLQKYQTIQRLTIKITKPDIISNATVSLSKVYLNIKT